MQTVPPSQASDAPCFHWAGWRPQCALTCRLACRRRCWRGPSALSALLAVLSLQPGEATTLTAMSLTVFPAQFLLSPPFKKVGAGGILHCQLPENFALPPKASRPKLLVLDWLTRAEYPCGWMLSSRKPWQAILLVCECVCWEPGRR